MKNENLSQTQSENLWIRFCEIINHTMPNK